MAAVILNAFNAGELSRQLDGRTDLAKYASGCRVLENFIPRAYGGVERRSGTEHVAAAKSAAVKGRLMGFEVSPTVSYVLEFGDQVLRFYRNGAQITSGSPAAAYEVATPYLEADLPGLKWVQSNDVAYLVHPDHKPRKLSRTADASWALAEVDFTDGPFLEENDGATTITPSYPAWATATAYAVGDCVTVTGVTYKSKTAHTSGAGNPTPPGNTTDWEVALTYTGTNLVLTASASLFEATQVGALWKVRHVRTDNATNGNYGAVTASTPIRVKGDWDFVTHGTWDGTIKVQRSYDDGATWEDLRAYTSVSDRNVAATGEETEDGALYRVNMTAWNSGTCRWDFTVADYYTDGVVKITARTSATAVKATVISAIGALTATKKWSEGAWSSYRGWPATVCFYEERLVYGGSEHKPQTLWFSRSGEYDTFEAGIDDDDAMIYTLNADRVAQIRWLIPQDFLLVGTAGGEWRIGSTDRDEPLTPKNVSAKQQSTYGSADIQAVLVNDVVLFVQRQGRKVREMAFSIEKEGYEAADLTILSNEITDGGISEIAYQHHHDSILWLVRGDGTLAGLTYERSHEVVGWHRHELGGAGIVESAAVISSTDEDELWLLVRRTVDGSTVRYLERKKPQAFDAKEDCWFLDSALEFDGGAAVAITAITKASPAVVSSTGHGLVTGNRVRIAGVTGMTEANGVFAVLRINDDSYSLKDETDAVAIDSTGWGTFAGTVTGEKVAKSFSGLTHLEGESVEIFADGAVYPAETVASGAVSIDRWVNKAVVGLGFTSTISPMRLDVPSMDGTGQGALKRIHEIVLRVYQSIHAKVGPSLSLLDTVYFRLGATAMDSAPPLFDGDKVLPFPGSWDRDGLVYVVQDKPLPLTLLAMILKLQVTK